MAKSLVKVAKSLLKKVEPKDLKKLEDTINSKELAEISRKNTSYKIPWEGPPIQQWSKEDTAKFVKENSYLLKIDDNDLTNNQLKTKLELHRLKYEDLAMGFQQLVDNKMPIETKRLAFWVGAYKNVEDERDFYINKCERFTKLITRLLPREEYLKFQQQEMTDSERLVNLMEQNFQMESLDIDKLIDDIKDRHNLTNQRRLEMSEKLKLENANKGDNKDVGQ